LQSGVEKIAGMGGWGLNPQPLDHCSQSFAYDLSATAKDDK